MSQSEPRSLSKTDIHYQYKLHLAAQGHACIVKDSIHLIGCVRQFEFNSLLHEVNSPSARH